MYFTTDINDKNWAWANYLSQRSLAQADNVRTQLERIMERYELPLITTHDQRRFYDNVRRALVVGYFMQVAHKEGEKGSAIGQAASEGREKREEWVNALRDARRASK